MIEWYCKLSGKDAGPFSKEELRYLRDRGKLAPTDEVREGTTGEWKPAGSLGKLFPAEVPGPLAPGEQAASAVGAAPGEQAASPVGAAPDEPASPTADAPAEPASRSASGAAPIALVPAGGPRKPPPPPGGPEKPDKTERVMLGMAIGAGVTLLILLLLLLLWITRPSGSGEGTLGGGGIEGGGAGGGSGTGIGSGIGEGVGDGAGPGGGAGGQGSAAASDTTAPPGDQSDDGTADQTGNLPQEPPPETGLSTPDLSGGKSRPASGGEGADGGGSGSGDVGEFFGVKARGRKFVYIVDCSGSMAGGPFLKACEELIKSLEGLNTRQSFYIMFFDSQNYPMFHPATPEKGLLRATRQNVARVQEWINTLGGGGGTQPRESLLMALRLEPDAVFLLTDGQFDPQTVDDVTRQNRRKVTINTVGFIHRAGEPLLKDLARKNRGEYRFVP